MTIAPERGALIGRTTPRLSTPPLVTGEPGPCGCGCALSPKTSLGFEAIDFAAKVLGIELLPWQRWWLIHALELRGRRYRFRTILTLVARQNGKTHLLKILSLWAMYMGRADLVLGAAQSLDIARESWQGAVDLAQGEPDLADEIATVRYANGEQCLTLKATDDHGPARYRITAATRSAGRGLSVDLLILDELREHRTPHAWAALSKTTMARPHALTVGISNAGDAESVVLNQLRAAALAGADEQLGIFEWSAPEGCPLDDPDAWAQAMPGLGITINEAAVRTSLATDPSVVFRTELLCQRVDALDAAVDPDAWRACGDPAASIGALHRQMVMGVDVSMTSGHVTATAAVVAEDGRVIGEVFDQWTDVHAARAGLRQAFEQYRPRAVGWFPSGPMTVLRAELEAAVTDGLIGEPDMIEPPEHAPGLVGLTGQDASSACQTLASLVEGRRFIHADDPLLNAHIAASTRKDQGDGWRFARRGAGDNDAAYAMAGAVHLARTLPVPLDYDIAASVF